MSVRATARVTAVRDDRGATSLPVLESEGPSPRGGPGP